MKYTNESHKAWVVRMLQEIAGTLDMERYGYIEHISAINYAIGYLIGIGWCDDQPTADVVEVVRCKDCIYEEDCGREVLVNEYDDKAVDITGFLFYCSYGERADT